ncbi:MAG: hypothetical protein ACI4U0_04925 [Candidatus Aphodocola sp.]
MYRIINDYKSQYIVISSRPGNGKTSTILENIKDDLLNGKKVLFFSLENSKDSIIKQTEFSNLDNLIILDNPIEDINDIKNSIIQYNPDIVYIDYIDLLPNVDGVNEYFHKLSIDYNIPVVVAHNLSMENDNYDLSTITITEFCKINSSSMIDTTDKYYLLYIDDRRNFKIRKLK